MIKTNDRVCFELDIDHEVVRAENPCDWNMKYRSVIGCGRAFLLEDIDEKRPALDIIAEHYSERVNEHEINTKIPSRSYFIRKNIHNYP